MPRGDGTGPVSMGSMTGRAAGFCAGFAAPGYANPMAGRGCGPGFGRGRGFGMQGGFGGGRGRGWRHIYHDTGMTGWQRATARSPAAAPLATQAPAKERQLEALKRHAETLGGELDAVRRRIEELSASEESK